MKLIPASFFGMHINWVGTPWPSVPFGRFRGWDFGASWANINTARGVYNWTVLDQWVAKCVAAGVEMTYVLGRTPPWASSVPTSPSNYASGENVQPADLTDWDEFITLLVARYKGRIKYYELWNEPNDAGFWRGTTAQLVTMAERAYNIIHTVDPDALVISPSPTWSATTAWQWLDDFLTKGGGQWVDIIGYHAYTGKPDAEASLFSILDGVQGVLNNHGVTRPQIITEGGWGLNKVVPLAAPQAIFLAQRYLLLMSRPNVQGFDWYQLDNSGWGTLLAGGKLTPAGVAYGVVAGWLVGAIVDNCVKDNSGTWTIDLTTASGLPAVIVWNSLGTTTYLPGQQFNHVQGIDGVVHTISGKVAYTINPSPVMFS